MPLSYPEIFQQRGNRYHQAMLRFPQARRAEFEQLFAARPVAARERVLDMPAGGAYLAGYLPEGCDLVSLELTPEFGGGVAAFDPDQPWQWGRFDRAVCLAALHHIEDQAGFLAGLLDKLAPDGCLHLADVPVGSSIGRFLDEFVGRYNETGHEGRYLPCDRDFYAALGEVARIGELPCPWGFENEAAMIAFCGQLFGLRDCPDAALLRALEENVGITRLADGGCRVEWRLMYVDLRPRPN